MKNPFLLFLLCFSGISFSQNSFLVKDENNTPVNGADVFYHKKRIGITAKEGKFLMPQAPAGDSVVFKFGGLTTVYVIDENKSGKGLTQVVYLAELKEMDFTPGEYGDVAVPPAVEDRHVSENEILALAEDPAEFPGGTAALAEWMRKNVRYPESAKESPSQGKCFVKFVVEKDGSITDVQVLKGVNGCPACDKEAIRVVKTMPKWKPARNNGAVVRSYFHLPISFKVD